MIRKLIQTTLCAVTLFAAAPIASAAPTVPTTAEQHVALATQYKEQAAAHRKEAQDHREMAAAYKTSSPSSQRVRRGEKTDWETKMEKHCELIATAADKLAAEDEKAADYHSLRAKELQGK